MIFNPLSNSFIEDPYAVYAKLRKRSEPYYWPELKMVMLSRYSDISQVALDKNMVRSLVNFKDAKIIEEKKRSENFHDMPYHERFVQKNLLDSDGPEHDRLRKLVLGAFTSRAVEAMEIRIQNYVDELIQALPRNEIFDIINDFAVHIPGLVIGNFLGTPDSDAPQLRLWSEQVVSYFDIDRTARKKTIAEMAVKDFHDYLVILLNDRRRSPKNDLLSKMIDQEKAGLFKPDELISTCMLILMAGHGSTIDVLGTGLHTLLSWPKEMQTLREDMSLLPVAIQEMFRFEPPLPFFHRHATEGISLRGYSYPPETTFGLLYASANRDETVFTDAARFDIARRPNQHLSFGRGAHLCLGNHLARLNMSIIFSTLLTQLQNIELAETTPQYKRGLSVRGLKALPIQVS